MNLHDAEPARAPAAPLPGGAAAMDDALCLAILTKAADGERVPRALLEAAHRWAGEHPACGRTAAELALLGEVLASEPARRTGPAFTGRVLEAAARQRETAAVLPLARRLALAAALLLALNLGWQLGHPVGTAADSALERQPHLVDVLRPRAFEAQQVEQALRQLLAAPQVTASPDGEGGGR